MWSDDTVHDPNDLRVWYPPVRAEYDKPEINEFVPYHVGRDYMHRDLEFDEYCVVRAKYDMRSYRQETGETFPRAARMAYIGHIAAINYGKFSQHRWLPSRGAWPFNLCLVTYTLMAMEEPNIQIGDVIINHLRNWGCPVSRYSGNYAAWFDENSSDPVFIKVCELYSVPSAISKRIMFKNLSVLANEWGGREHTNG